MIVEDFQVWVPIILSIIALGVSIIVFFRARPIEKKQYDASSMLFCFRILSDIQLKKSKSIVAFWYRQLKKEGKSVLFPDSIEDHVIRVRGAYDQACALYQLDLLNKENFRIVYGGSVVSTWKMMDEDIFVHRKTSNNENICKHFGNVAKELMDAGETAEPY